MLRAARTVHRSFTRGSLISPGPSSPSLVAAQKVSRARHDSVVRSLREAASLEHSTPLLIHAYGVRAPMGPCLGIVALSLVQDDCRVRQQRAAVNVSRGGHSGCPMHVVPHVLVLPPTFAAAPWNGRLHPTTLATRMALRENQQIKSLDENMLLLIPPSHPPTVTGMAHLRSTRTA
jgi:hypothetical protein